MENTFEVGAKYSASQNISRLALSSGHVPLFFKGLVYLGIDAETSEHIFEDNGQKYWFDDAFINNGKSEDNSMIFGKIG